MGWLDLDPDEVNQAHTYDRESRALAGELSQVLAKMQVLVDYHDAVAGAVMNEIGADEIPSQSGLAGIVLKNGNYMNAVNAAFETILSVHYTAAKRQTYLELAGPENVLPPD